MIYRYNNASSNSIYKNIAIPFSLFLDLEGLDVLCNIPACYIPSNKIWDIENGNNNVNFGHSDSFSPHFVEIWLILSGLTVRLSNLKFLWHLPWLLVANNPSIIKYCPCWVLNKNSLCGKFILLVCIASCQSKPSSPAGLTT